jgi:hypothetical protein
MEMLDEAGYKREIDENVEEMEEETKSKLVDSGKRDDVDHQTHVTETSHIRHLPHAIKSNNGDANQTSQGGKMWTWWCQVLAGSPDFSARCLQLRSISPWCVRYI